MEIQIQTTKTYNDINTDNRIIILRGGTRSGKSYSTIQYLIVQALSTPGTVISVVRKTLPSLKKSIFRDFKRVMSDLNLWEESEYKSTEMVYHFYNKSIIEFFSVADDQRIRGSQRDILFCDESNEMSYDEFFQLNIRTVKKSIIAFNPSFNKTTSWIYNNVAIREDAKEFISTYKDNVFLPQSIIDEIERLKETSPSLYNIYAKGEFGNIEGLIFDNFNIIDNLPELDQMELLGYGMDFGFSKDPTTLVVAFRFNDNIVIKELLYKKGLLINNIKDEILNNYNIYGIKQVVADSAEPRTIEELRRYNGVIIVPAKKGPDSIQFGIDLIKQHKLLITKDSINLINELYNYVYLKDKNGNSLNVPKPGDDHLIDGVRYILTHTLGQKRENFGKYSFSFV